MVTRSPFSACVKSVASEEGASRSGASASAISNSSPLTKRAAATLPSRYFAARSGRAGIRRGSSIAFAQQFVDRVRRLAFAAFRARRFRRWRPTVDVDMQPAFRVFDETLQEQRAGEGAGKSARRCIVDIGDLRVEPGIVSRPQRQAPQRIVLLFRASRDVLRQPLIVGVKGR